MNLQRIAIDRLVPAPYNPRVALKPGMPGYKRLERSLREFDLVQPLVWNERTGHVVGGHQRLEILKAKGVTEVDVVVVNLTLAREKALNVALNNQLVGGGWDAGKLVDVMQELQQSAELDATLTGFDENELRDLLMIPDESFAEDDTSDDSGELVQVRFEVAAETWEALRGELDAVLGEHGVRAHVRKG